MRRNALLLVALVASLCAVPAFAQTSPAPRHHTWWMEPPAGAEPYTVDAKKLPLLRVQGNRIVDPSGKPVLLRGVNIADPDKLTQQGHWNREFFEKVKDLGTTLVRIPVHPIAWREIGAANYLQMLDQAVGWCTDLNMYVIIDWHSIGNMTTGVYQDPMYITNREETFTFWRAIARHYNGHNTVAFLELFNEPAAFGRVSWEEWRRIVEDEIAAIRDVNTQAIPLVAAFDWAYDLTPLHLSPINAEGIAYTVHPYEMKRTRPWEPKWDEDFGFAAAQYPILATEFGTGNSFEDKDTPGQEPYEPALIRYLESRGIGWAAWSFDPDWGAPPLISNWNYDLTPRGKFLRSVMHGEFK